MILKYLFLTVAALILVTASDPYYGIDLSFNPSLRNKSTHVSEITWQSPESIRPFLEDRDNKVSDVFKVTPYYFPTVYFWFLIYTQFESSQIVIHDKTNLKLIYKVLDFSSLAKSEIPANTRFVLQQKISDEKVDDLKSDLDFLAMNPFSTDPRAKAVLQIIKQAGIELPNGKSDRSAYVQKLRQNLRTQTGQKNFIREGIIRSLPYVSFIRTYFHAKGLPLELMSIPFLESSFNPGAESRVSALGVWQFMPLIASYYMPKRSSRVDYRSNVGVSSVAAAFLMKENFSLLRSWDLAVTAYNSGTKHLLKTKRELATENANLEGIIRHSDSEHFGFASKNFYSEFLALAHALAYREELFDGLHEHDREDVREGLKFYLTKCALKLESVLSTAELNDVLFHNDQLEEGKLSLPRGTIVTAKHALPGSRFLQVSQPQLLKFKPKEWTGLLGFQSCSTR